MLFLNLEGGKSLQFLTVFGIEEGLEEHCGQRLVGVLLVEGCFHVRAQFLGLFLQLVDRDLANEHREVF